MNCSKIDLFKIIKWTKHKENLFFSLFGDDVKNKNKNKSLRPIVIIFESNTHYYYLKLRKAKLDMLDGVKHTHNIEVFIPFSELSSLPLVDSYIDCNQIFKIKKEDFLEIIDLDHIDYKETRILGDDKKREIIKVLHQIFCDKDPNVSFVEIIYNKNLLRTYAKTIYASQKMMEKEKMNYKKNDKNTIIENIALLHNKWNKQHINEIKRIIEINYQTIVEKGN